MVVRVEQTAVLWEEGLVKRLSVVGRAEQVALLGLHVDDVRVTFVSGLAGRDKGEEEEGEKEGQQAELESFHGEVKLLVMVSVLVRVRAWVL
jgi:hypothetical protein